MQDFLPTTPFTFCLLICYNQFVNKAHFEDERSIHTQGVVVGSEGTPSNHNFFDSTYVRHWLEETTAKYPERPAFFDTFVSEVNSLNLDSATVVELGSGPGVLAEQLLDRCSIERYWLVDFSLEMHALARERLGDEHRAIYVQADFKDPEWTSKVKDRADIAVSMQAVHELRDANRTPDLYRQLADVVCPGGLLLVCDHLRPSHDERPVFMTVEEHLAALRAGGDPPTLRHPSGREYGVLQGELFDLRSYPQNSLRFLIVKITSDDRQRKTKNMYIREKEVRQWQR